MFCVEGVRTAGLMSTELGTVTKDRMSLTIYSVSAVEPQDTWPGTAKRAFLPQLS